MSPDEEKYYDNYFSLFVTEGWQEFVSEIQTIIDNQRIEDIKDESQLNYIKGERAAFKRITQFEGGIRLSYDLIKEREAEQ